MEKLLEYYNSFDQHLLEDEQPSLYFTKLLEEGQFPDDYPFTMISDLMNVDQNPKFHPEGNVWNHTMEVIDFAAKYRKYSTNAAVFMWAALLHDVGKATTTMVRKGRLTAYDHDREGERMARKFLQYLQQPESFIQKVTKMVRWHMQPLFVNKNLPFAKLKYMIRDTSVAEIGLFSLCDRLGRGPLSEEREMEECLRIMEFLTKCYDRVEIDEESEKIEKVVDLLSHKIHALNVR